MLQSGTAGSRSVRQVALLIGGRRRVEPLGWARRLGLLELTPQDHRWNKGTRLGQAIFMYGAGPGGGLLGGGGGDEASSFKVEAGP